MVRVKFTQVHAGNFVIDLPKFYLIDPFETPVKSSLCKVTSGKLNIKLLRDWDGDYTTNIETAHDSIFKVNFNLNEKSKSDSAKFSFFATLSAAIGLAIIATVLFCFHTFGACIFFGLVASIGSIGASILFLNEKSAFTKTSIPPKRKVEMTFGTFIPGKIPNEMRKTLKQCRDIAHSMGGNVGLIVESDWKLLDSVKITPVEHDPIVVIYKGKDFAYIDRFDCTADETRLAQEHVTQV
jgi:hypothetical protein